MQSGGASGSFSRQTGAALIWLVAGYKRLISPLLPSACRFYPTCSDYMREAIAVHGPAQGVWLGVKRLARCHPLHAGGFDLVPAKNVSAENVSAENASARN
jgi:putative membrane protein insertion efficiency factor